MGDVLRFPGAGTPAPGGHPPRITVDLDGVGDRYTSLLEARAAQDWDAVRLLEGACADDIEPLRDLIHTLQTRIAAVTDRHRAETMTIDCDPRICCNGTHTQVACRECGWPMESGAVCITVELLTGTA